MPNYRRANICGGTYFFTVVTYRRQPFLCDDDIRAWLRMGIEQTRIRFPFEIDAWVLLPDHLHCIWTLPAGDADFGKRWSMIKRFVSKQSDRLKRVDWLNHSRQKRNESTVWQRRFWEHQIRDDRDFEKHADYIHHNPVNHGHVATVKEWPYSTFHQYVKDGIYPLDWAGTIDDFDRGHFGDL